MWHDVIGSIGGVLRQGIDRWRQHPRRSTLQRHHLARTPVATVALRAYERVDRPPWDLALPKSSVRPVRVAEQDGHASLFSDPNHGRRASWHTGHAIPRHPA